MVKRKNNKAFNFMDAIFWNQLKIKSKLLREICHVFYPPRKPKIPRISFVAKGSR